MASMTPSLSSAIADRIARGVYATPDGGTVPLHVDRFDSGYVVGGVVPSLVLDPSSPTDTVAREIAQWVHAHADAIATADSVGWWTDTVDGRVHVDASDIVADRDEALAIGRARGEIALWDIAADTELRCAMA